MTTAFVSVGSALARSTTPVAITLIVCGPAAAFASVMA